MRAGTEPAGFVISGIVGCGEKKNKYNKEWKNQENYQPHVLNQWSYLYLDCVFKPGKEG